MNPSEMGRDLEQVEPSNTDSSVDSRQSGANSANGGGLSGPHAQAVETPLVATDSEPGIPDSNRDAGDFWERLLERPRYGELSSTDVDCGSTSSRSTGSLRRSRRRDRRGKPAASVRARAGSLRQRGRRSSTRGWTLPLLCLGLGVGGAAYFETTHAPIQSRMFHRYAQAQTFELLPGKSPTLKLPTQGPFDRRLGYTRIDEFSRALERAGFTLRAQARMAPGMLSAIELGLYPAYSEKTTAGLVIRDCANLPLFARRYPERTYDEFRQIPELLRSSLVFVENRELLRPRASTQNPAVEWPRFAGAVVEQIRALFDSDYEGTGASTLATQIEKYRHSAEGRTSSAAEKLRQMASASLRAYRQGEDTRATRQRLVIDYLNTVPLSARVGHGEVNGIGDGLWVWYGRDFDTVNRLLRNPDSNVRERALAFKQALSLIVAERRPNTYLVEAPEGLDRITNVILDRLAEARLISTRLRDAALAERVVPGTNALPQEFIDTREFIARKASTAARSTLSKELGSVPLYALERMDIEARSTFDTALQERISNALLDISSSPGAERAGLIGRGLLSRDAVSGITYSFTLYERSEAANWVRVQTDNLGKPFDLNSGSKLDLGSTAKLRTLISYLEIIAEIHARQSAISRKELRELEMEREDALSSWVRIHLLESPPSKRDLEATLRASLERRYSADPDERFFTDGGVLRFSNFDPSEDRTQPTVREGLERSTNLLFIRLMRDVVNYLQWNAAGSSVTLLRDRDDPKRGVYLKRFADREGSAFVRRFYRKHSRQTADDRLADLVRRGRADPRRLAAILAGVREQASSVELAAFLDRARAMDSTIPELAATEVEPLHERIIATGQSLSDLGFIAGIHPLELWTVRFLTQRPDASVDEALEASRDTRQETYRWLFRTTSKRAQDDRIRTLLELEAFVELHRRWQRLGYPFDSLVPSYATALGSSADRPAALAELIGILVADGVRNPTRLLSELRFGVDTPYETWFEASAAPAERVLSREVAMVAREALAGVVERGTARRLRGAFEGGQASSLTLGAKTGTGDHRSEVLDADGRVLSSRVLSRSGTLVFYIGESHFGVLTAYVEGPPAANYSFTSALPTQVLRYLAPLIQPRLAPEAEPAGAAEKLPAGSPTCPIYPEIPLERYQAPSLLQARLSSASLRLR